MFLPVEEVGTSDMVTAAAGGVSESTAMADPADHDLEVAAFEEADLLVVAAAVAGALAAAAAAERFAAAVAARVLEVENSRAGPECPADLEGLDPAAAAEVAAAGEGCTGAVLVETVGSGCREADLGRGHGHRGIVGKEVLAARVGREVETGVLAVSRGAQSYSVVGRGTEAAAGPGEVGGHADHSSPDSAGCSPPGPVVHRLTSKHGDRKISEASR